MPAAISAAASTAPATLETNNISTTSTSILSESHKITTPTKPVITQTCQILSEQVLNQPLFNCFGTSREIRKIEKLFDKMPVNNQIQRDAIKQRYLYILNETRNRSILYSRFYYFGHLIVTVGSLIVPALLSIQYTSTNSTKSLNNFDEQIYWVTWGISLLVTIFNGILTLFGVDKKYFTLQVMLEKLKSEGYQFFALSGRYTDKNSRIPQITPKYDSQIILFSYQIERIIQKQIENEFSKEVEDDTNKKKDDQKNHIYSLHSPDEMKNDSQISESKPPSYNSVTKQEKDITSPNNFNNTDNVDNNSNSDNGCNNNLHIDYDRFLRNFILHTQLINSKTSDPPIDSGDEDDRSSNITYSIEETNDIEEGVLQSQEPQESQESHGKNIIINPTIKRKIKSKSLPQKPIVLSVKPITTIKSKQPHKSFENI